jgi:hypothetical protein
VYKVVDVLMAVGDVLHHCVRWKITGLKDRFTFTENSCKGGHCPVEISLCRMETINKIRTYGK